MSSELTIIIISYNSFVVIEDGFHELIESNKYNVLIVDNASQDQSAIRLKDRFRTAKIISLDNNIGYGRAANIALKQVQTPYALLMNPDLKVSTEIIDQFVEQVKLDNDAAMWGPSFDNNNTQNETPILTEWICGCAMLFDMKILCKTGWFDENIFLFYEESDLCKRITGAGYSIKKFQNLYVEHLEGTACEATPPIIYLKEWHYGWGRCYFYRKHHPELKKRGPARQFLLYSWKSIFSTTKQKRFVNKTRAAGALAFFQGLSAFDEQGVARGYRPELA